MIPVQGPWYEATISKLSTASPTGCVQTRLMEFGDKEFAVLMVGAEARRTTNKNKHDQCQQLKVPSRRHIS